MFFGIEYLIMFVEVVFVFFIVGISRFFISTNSFVCLNIQVYPLLLVEIVCMIADMLFIRIVVPGIVIN